MEYREIPYNYTSANDQTLVEILLGKGVWQDLQFLRDKRITGKTSRLIFRFIGDQFIYLRNPYLYQDLLSSSRRRRKVFGKLHGDLVAIRKNCLDPISQRIFESLWRQYKSFKKEILSTPRRQNKILRAFGRVMGKENVSFSPYDLVAHATDATDWRYYLPIAVLRPGHA